MPRGAIAGALVASLAMACGLFIGLDEPKPQNLPPLPEAGPVIDDCAHVAAPDFPTSQPDSGAGVPPFWLALRNSYIGQSATTDAGVPGLDLDGTCTCMRGRTAFDGGPSCLPRGGAAAQCDYDGGIDNSVEQVFGAYSSIFDANGYLARVVAGREDLIIYVANYNGEANDLDVSIGFAQSDGIYTSACDPTLQINDNPPGDAHGSFFNASWRGCDAWHGIEEQFVGSPSVPESYVPKALGKGVVKDGVLIMKGASDVPVFINSSTARVQDGTLIAPLEKVPGRQPADPVRFRINGGVLAGRLRLVDMAEIAFNSSYSGVFTCQNQATFTALMSALCGGADLTDSATEDHTGEPCTAMSFAFRFDADVADLDRDPHTPPDDSPNPCRAMTVPPIETLCPQ
jgi:hypothetical protein